MKYERDANGWFPGAGGFGSEDKAAECGYCPGPICKWRDGSGRGCHGADAYKFAAWAEANPEEYRLYAEEVKRQSDEVRKKMYADYHRGMGWN